jgi:hypothetical protein
MAVLFRSMTAKRCDCCDGVFVDEVAAMLIEDAVIAYRDELEAKANRDARAWREADRVTQQALKGLK